MKGRKEEGPFHTPRTLISPVHTISGGSQHKARRPPQEGAAFTQAGEERRQAGREREGSPFICGVGYASVLTSLGCYFRRATLKD